ncbi:unnamed protein product [Tilletia laevis]|nr:unnamed protein product [Tilletia laevis]
MTIPSRAAHAPPTRTKKRHLSRSNEHPTDPAILALQAQHQSHNVSSSRDASEEDNDDEDDDDDLDDDHDEHDDDQDQPGNAEGERTKLPKAERAARRAAARRHPSSDDADIPPSIMPASNTNTGTAAGTLALNAPLAEPSTVSPSRRASTHAHAHTHAHRDRDPQPHVSNTLAHASAALHQQLLSNSSSASNGDEEDGDRTSSSASQAGGFKNQGDIPPSTLLARRVPGAAAANDGGHKLHLGSLPDVKSEDIAASDAPLTVTSQGSDSLALPTSATQTPKVPSASTAAGAPLSILSPVPASAATPTTSAPARNTPGHPHKKTTLKSAGLARAENEDGEDPLTDGAGGTPYDGDVEGPNPSKAAHANANANQPGGASANSVPFPTSPIPPSAPTGPPSGGASSSTTQNTSSNVNAYGSAPNDTILTLPNGRPRPRARVRSDASDKEHAILAAPRPPEEIRAYMRDCISGERAKGRGYKINEPRAGGGTRERPIRIYADGVFDMFHYAHTLLLRQAKLFFPHVHLIAGVNSSTLCAEHKNRPLLSSEERYASVGSCKWVDEVVVDAPWFITPEFIEAHRIDYVAHDDLPYANASSGVSDVYGWLKERGIFLPTLRTEGVSTSELLGRVVEVYQTHALDDKLRKVGLEKLIDSRSPSGQTSPHHAPEEKEGDGQQQL